MNRRPAFVAALLGAAFFLVSWFLWTDSRHFIDGGDVFFPIDQRLLLSKIGGVWYPDQLGSVTYDLAVVPLRAIFALLQTIGVSSVNIERLFLAIGYGVAAAATYLCARQFWQDRATALIAAVWYPCSMSYCLAIPNENNVVALALIPVLLWLGLKAIADFIYVIPFAIVSVLFGFVSSNPPTLVLIVGIIAVLWFIGAYGRASWKRLAAVAIALLAGAVVANGWWIPAAKAALSANKFVAAGVTDLSWALSRSNLVSIMEQTSFWGFGFGSDPWLTIGRWYLTHPVPHTALVLTPVLAFSALYFLPFERVRHIRIAALTVLCVLAVLLAKGEHDPFGQLSGALYSAVPGLFLFREPVKFLFVLAFVLPLLAAVAHYELTSRAPTPVAYALSVLFIAVPIITGWSLLTGWAFALHQSQARIEIPQYWYQTAAFLNANNVDHDRVLLLPEDGFYQSSYKWGLQGVDRIAETTIDAPVLRLTSRQYTYLQNQYAGRALEIFDRSLRTQRADWIRNEMQRLSVSYIIVRGDVGVDGRRMSLPEVHEDLSAIGARQISQFGPLEVYRVDSGDAVSVPHEILRSCASPRGELQAAMRLAPAISIIRSSTPECRKHRNSLQHVGAAGVTAPAGSIVLSLSAVQPADITLKAAHVSLPSRTRVAGDVANGPLNAINGARVSAHFCGPWRFEPSPDGWIARRCVATGTAAFIRLSSTKYDATHFPVSLEFRWLPAGQNVSVPLGVALSVATGAHEAEISLVPWRTAVSLQLLQNVVRTMALQSVYPYAPVRGGPGVFYGVDRVLHDGIVVNGVDEPAEFIFRLPSGDRISAFIRPEIPSSFDALELFEDAYQVYANVRPQHSLRLDRVTFEGVALPFPRGTQPTITLTVSTDPWSVTRLRHAQDVKSTDRTDVYVGRAVPVVQRPVSFRKNASWNDIAVAAADPGWILMRQSYSDYWAFSGAATHAVLDGYGNAWFVPNPGEHKAYLSLAPEQTMLYALCTTAFLLLCGVLLKVRRVPNETP